MSYVGEITPTNAAMQAAQYTASSQAAAADPSSPVFAEILAAQLDARMMNIASSDQGSDLSDMDNTAGLLLAGAMLESMDADSVFIPTPPQAEIEPAAQEPEPVSYSSSIESEPIPQDTLPMGGLQVGNVYSTGMRVTNAYAGPPLSMYADPVEAYSQFDVSGTDSVRTSEELREARILAADYAVGRVGDPYSQSLRGVDDYVDCSYLTKWAFRQVGIALPATAAEQARYCAVNDYEIPTSQLQKGDLIFWQRKGCTCGRYNEIHHVAVYLGDGQIVEASSSKGQVITNSMWGDDGVGKWQIAMCARPS